MGYLLPVGAGIFLFIDFLVLTIGGETSLDMSVFFWGGCDFMRNCGECLRGRRVGDNAMGFAKLVGISALKREEL